MYGNCDDESGEPGVINVNQVSSIHWDYVIVGTGMGGSTFGYALARAGKRILFCEQGRDLTAPDVLRGPRVEELYNPDKLPGTSRDEIYARTGRSTLRLEDTANKLPLEPFIGCGTGGSTAIYGMILERFMPMDFAPGQCFPDDRNESSIPDHWPVSYGEMAPYYDAAEKLYRVKGAVDPLYGKARESLGAPPALSPASRELFDHIQAKGFHPYRVPRAFDNVPECESCMGYLCAKECKNDALRISLLPAIKEHGAALLDRCVVEKLHAGRSRVTSIECVRNGERFRVSGENIVLAAGALKTPAILLNSASELWPDGLANDSGLVGRNLMRHLMDLYIIWPRYDIRSTANLKEIAFNDLYFVDGRKMGTVQSFGRMFAPLAITSELARDVRRNRIPGLPGLFNMAAPLLRKILRRYFEKAIVLAALIEDLPYHRNRVYLPPDSHSGMFGNLLMDYTLSRRDEDRVVDMRRRMKEMLKPYRMQLLPMAENNELVAHVCGTCRFGNDPRESVLDRDNRAHGIENLYVVDASFFPSSSGTNPALTIAANALRVAEKLLATRDSVTVARDAGIS